MGQDYTKLVAVQQSGTGRIKFVILISSLLIFLLCSNVQAQSYRKQNKKVYKAYYRKQNSVYAKACDKLEKKKRVPKRSTFARSKGQKKTSQNVSTQQVQNTSNAEDIVAKVDTREKSVVEKEDNPREKVIPKIEQISDERLAELHKKEMQVLEENDLPRPTSEQHDKIRKQIADKLASKTNVYPLELAPLYFTFDEDEFSVVDMEPFLIAAEYALQGRTLLIEGHTDNRGSDDYNVKLSIKRVQKIRQLMLDMGVPDERISVVGYGEELQKSKTGTNEGHQLNRRVDFVVF